MKSTNSKVTRTNKQRNNARRRAMRRSTRCIIIIAMLAIGALSFSFGSFFSSAHDSESADAVRCYKSIEVEYGDTLWSIAEEYMDSHYDSVQEYIEELSQINHLENRNLNDIQEGAFITVVYYE